MSRVETKTTATRGLSLCFCFYCCPSACCLPSWTSGSDSDSRPDSDSRVCCLAGLLPGLGLARTPEPAGQPDSDSDSDSQVCWPVGLGLDS
jgi:hypothetical protein